MNRKKKTLYILGLTTFISSILGISAVIRISNMLIDNIENPTADETLLGIYQVRSLAIQAGMNNTIELIYSVSGALFLFFCFLLIASFIILHQGDRTNG